MKDGHVKLPLLVGEARLAFGVTGLKDYLKCSNI